MPILLPEESLVLTVLNSFSRLCLLGIAETPGCATLLPASLFVNSHSGTEVCVLGLPGAAASNSISSMAKAWTGGVGTRLGKPQSQLGGGIVCRKHLKPDLGFVLAACASLRISSSWDHFSSQNS